MKDPAAELSKDSILASLRAVLEKALASAGLRKRFIADGAELVTTTPGEFAAFIKSEIARRA